MSEEHAEEQLQYLSEEHPEKKKKNQKSKHSMSEEHPEEQIQYLRTYCSGANTICLRNTLKSKNNLSEVHYIHILDWYNAELEGFTW